MARLIGIDGSLALVDMDETISGADAIQLLLDVRPEEPGGVDFEKTVVPILGRWCYPMPYRWWSVPLDEQSPLLRDWITSDRGSRPYPVDISGSVWRVRQLSAQVQYLCRLHLLAKGDERHADMIDNLEFDGVWAHFDSMTPVGIIPTVHERFSMVKTKQVEPEGDKRDGFEKYHFDVSLGYDEEEDGPLDSFDQKRAAAASLLVWLLNRSDMVFYEVDNLFGIQREEHRSVYNELADLMIAGKIYACPTCGRPVLMARKNSNPFCKKSHQTRYSERARAMFRNGATVDEVADRFKHINRATIANWERGW